MKYYWLIIFYTSYNLKAQNIKSYITSNSITIEELSKSNALSKDFEKYKYYFFGEFHIAKDVEKKEMQIAEYLIQKKAISTIFSETSVAFGLNYDKLLNSDPIDTSLSQFRRVSDQNYLEEFTLRKVYTLNAAREKKDNKIKYIPIDEVDYSDVNPGDLINLFNRSLPKEIRQNVLNLKKIKRRILNKKKNRNNYFLFCNNFMKDSLLYKEYLVDYKYKYLKNVVDGMRVYFEMQRHNEHSDNIGSERRDSFMCSNISSKTINGSLPFISINGQFHITLKKEPEWFMMKNWKSLAYQFNEKYGNVCSVCFINRENDYLSDQYFPAEKKLILENTKPGETYLIRLDGENSPFKELSEKFQYIVVW